MDGFFVLGFVFFLLVLDVQILQVDLLVQLDLQVVAICHVCGVLFL